MSTSAISTTLTQRGRAATENRNISRKGAKHVLSEVEGAAKEKRFQTWRLGASKGPCSRVTDIGKFAQAAETFKHSRFNCGILPTRRDGYTIAHVYLLARGVLMHVAKWGNSLAVRLPAAVVEALDLKEGDNIEIDVAGVRRFEIKKAPGTRELLARLRKYRGRLPADFRFDRIEANARR